MALVSIISSVTLNLKNIPLYYFLTSKNNFITIEENNNEPISFIIAATFCWISLTFTQCKIEKYNESVDQHLQQHQPNVQVMEEENPTTFCEKDTIKVIVKIIVFIFFTILCFYISITLYTSLSTEVVYIKILRVNSIKDLIMHNVIPMIFIAGSENLISFIKTETLRIIKLCKCNSNQIEPAMIELNVV